MESHCGLFCISLVAEPLSMWSCLQGRVRGSLPVPAWWHFSVVYCQYQCLLRWCPLGNGHWDERWNVLSSHWTFLFLKSAPVGSAHSTPCLFICHMHISIPCPEQLLHFNEVHLLTVCQLWVLLSWAEVCCILLYFVYGFLDSLFSFHLNMF